MEDTPTDPISTIKDMFKSINENSSLRQETSDSMDESSKWWEVVKCFSGDNLVKAVKTLYRETGKLVQEFYFSDWGLFFAFEQAHEYNRPMYRDEQTIEENRDDEAFDPEKSVIKEHRYYFSHNEIIQYIWPDGSIEKYPADPEAQRSIKAIWAAVKKIQN